MEKTYQLISRNIAGHLLNNAFALLRPWVAGFSSAGESNPWSDRLQSLQKNYRYLSDYFLSGADDPHREEVMAALVREAYILLDDVYLEKRLRESTAYEFRQMLAAEAEQLTPIVVSENDLQGPPQVFRFFWLTRHLEEWELSILIQYVENPEMEEEALLGITGLTLNLLRSFNERNLLYLIRCCNENYEQQMRERAWVGLLLVLLHYDQRLRFFSAVTNALQELLDTDEGQVYSCTTLACLIRTAGVEYAGKSYSDMQSHILHFMDQNPGMIVPQNGKIVIDDMDDFGENSEEIREQLAEDGKEIRRMKELFLDANFAMFRGMYRSSWFSDPFHWWLPFDTDYLENDNQRKSAQMMDKLQMNDLCDSDRWAFVTNMADMVDSMAVPEDALPVAEQSDEILYLLCNPYTQQAYRFFFLNPWGIPNVFEDLQNLPKSHLLRLLAPEASQKGECAEHLFRCHDYWKAAQMYELVVDSLGSAELLRHYALCLQKLSLYEQAIDYYRRSLSKEQNEWALRQLAYCQEHLLQWEDLLETVDILLALRSDDATYLYKKGKCLEHLGLFAESLDVYYRLLVNQPDNAKLLRSVAWCEMLHTHYEEAERYYQRIFAFDKGKMTDHLNYGHLLFIMGRRMDALTHYQLASQMASSRKEFLAAFRPDRSVLLEHGVSKSDIYLMEDQLIATL